MPRYQLTPEDRKKGQFKKGKTGNTYGTNTPLSDRGVREAARKAFGEAVKLQEKVLIAVQDVAVQKALAGDGFCIATVMRHHLPIPRSEAQPQPLPGFDAADAVTSAEAIFRAVANGELSLERGNIAMQMVYQRCQVSFTNDQISKLHKIKELLQIRARARCCS